MDRTTANMNLLVSLLAQNMEIIKLDFKSICGVKIQFTYLVVQFQFQKQDCGEGMISMSYDKTSSEKAKNKSLESWEGKEKTQNLP